MSQLKTVTATWVGIRPLIMHNGAMADRTNKWTIKKKTLTDAKDKNRADEANLQIEHASFMGSLYWDEKVGIYIPSENIERCMQLGAQKFKKGKEVVAACFCQEAVNKLKYDGPKDPEKLFLDPSFSLRTGVVIARKRVMSVRPIFNSWAVTFTVEYDAGQLNEDTIVRAMVEAGALIGLGDWRPKYGRFTVER